MTTPITADATVAQLVTERPELIRIFEKLGIDYCCGGKTPLGEACAQRNLDANSVVLTLQAVAETTRHEQASATDWTQASLTDLSDHIEETHHRYLAKELPRLETIVAKVVDAHAPAHPELHEIQAVYTRLSRDLLQHTQKEDQVLFPLIRQLESGGKRLPMSVAVPIQQMEKEHDEAGDDLKTIRGLTRDFAPPADACQTYRVMLDGLHELEKDTHEHIHKENNILFPRAIAFEEQLVG